MYRRMRFPGFLGKALTLSYDDGVQTDARLIEIMQKHGLKGTFNINSGLFAKEGTVYPKGQVHRRMSKNEAYALYKDSGMEIATHAFNHPHLESLTTTEITGEIMLDRVAIEKETGVITRGHAYPYGTFSDKVVECLKSCGMLYARGVNSTFKFDIPEDFLRLQPTCHHKAGNLMELARKFVEMSVLNEPQLFYLWGHSYEFDGDNNWNVIEEFAQFIGNKDDIWYATNTEIFEYIEHYKRIITSGDGDIVYNPTSIPLYFNVWGKEYKLNPGETVKLR